MVPFYINFAPGGDPGDALRSHLLTLFWNHFFVLPVPFWSFLPSVLIVPAAAAVAAVVAVALQHAPAAL